MKKWLFFGGGFLAGAIVCLLIICFIGLRVQDKCNLPVLLGATYFEEPKEDIDATSFKVLQVITDNAALVNSKEDPGSKYYWGQLYLLVNTAGHYYYDDEIINIEPGCRVRQLGRYQYTAKSGTTKTVPIIGVMNR